MRYFVTEPVEGGTQWYDVRDRDSEVMPNFAVASFSARLKNAAKYADNFCAGLNAA